LAWIWEESGLSGGDHFPVGGYRAVVEPLSDGLDVRLNHVVTAVRQTSGGVEIDAAGQTFVGAQALVTVPVGVLKAGSISFSPGLSAPKVAALGRLQMGNLEKVALVWPTAWPDGNVEIVDATVDGVFPEFYDMTTFAGAPAMLGLYGGGFARQVQAGWTDADVVTGALASLALEHGAPPPAPSASAVTRWTTDPFAGGSYVFLPVGASRADLDALAVPQGRVGFAGEATVFAHYGNVHAAAMSGLREAHRLGLVRVSTPGLVGW
jgi:monoamine oxidase